MDVMVPSEDVIGLRFSLNGTGKGFPPARLGAAAGAEVAHPGGGLREAQHLGGLAVGKLLEVAEQDDLTVVLLQAQSAASNRD